MWIFEKVSFKNYKLKKLHGQVSQSKHINSKLKMQFKMQFIFRFFFFYSEQNLSETRIKLHKKGYKNKEEEKIIIKKKIIDYCLQE